MTDERLLLPATRALVEGWCGPVIVSQNTDDAWLSYGEVDQDGDVLVAGSHITWYNLDKIRFDLSRAECRDRVARVVAGLALAPRAGLVDSCTAHTWEWAPAMDQRRWTLSGNGGGRGWEHFGLKSVPALAALDPNDDTRLPDGSRLVDALALALVARHVLGVER